MDLLSNEDILQLIQFVPDLTNLSMTCRKFYDIVSFARDNNLLVSKREYFLRIDKQLKQNNGIVIMKPSEFIWRKCHYLEDLGIYYGSTQQILPNDKLARRNILNLFCVW